MEHSDPMDIVTIAGAQLSAQINPLGAELARLQDGAQRDVLWDGDPAFWSGRAPLLFPMVGRAKDDRIVVDGRAYPLPQHGFARRMRFSLAQATSEGCVFSLVANEATRAAWPFEFRLDVEYRIAGAALAIVATVTNVDRRDMPCSFGFHPAFRWPLPGAAARENHAIVFDKDEPAPIRRLACGLLTREAIASPVEGNRLALSDVLFAHDALVFDRLASRRATYVARGGASVALSFPDMPHLGVWSKPGAGFVCIEPWQGFASPEDFDGEFADKPGVVRIAPGEARRFAMGIEVS
jgi:galactose mutarotase-like enzyme